MEIKLITCTNDLSDKNIGHMNFVISFKGISKIVEAFILAHGMNKYEHLDTEGKREIIEPKFIVKEGIDREYFINKYKSFAEECIDLYEELIKKDADTETAKLVLPYTIASNMVCSFSFEQLEDLIKRCMSNSLKEIEELKEVGEKLIEILKDKAGYEVEINSNKIAKKQRMEEVIEKMGTSIDMKPDRKGEDSVELISYEEDAERMIGMAALISYTNCRTHYAQIKVNDTDNLKNILEVICSEKDNKELENISYTFRINNLNLTELMTLSKYKVGGNLESTISRCEKTKEYTEIQNIDDEMKEKVNELFEKSNELLSLLDNNTEKNNIYNLCMLGNKNIDLVATFNARELYNLFENEIDRCDNSNIKDIASEMLILLREVAPFIFSEDVMHQEIIVD